jgi:hypothetical protein
MNCASHSEFPDVTRCFIARTAHRGKRAHGQKQKMLEDRFYETLKDIYYAEKKILTALPQDGESCPVGSLAGCLRETRLGAGGRAL